MYKKSVVIVLVLVLLSGMFYWWQWRPSRIRSACANETAEKLNKANDEGVKRKLVDWERNYDMLFQACINKRGLK